MNNEIVKALEKLVAEHGAEAVSASSEVLAQHMGLNVPLDHLGVLHPKQIEYTVKQLDGAAGDILKAGERREESYQHISELRAQVRELETSKELTEANAMMGLKMIGKNMCAVVDGMEVPLTNDTMRNSFRRKASSMERSEISLLEGQIAKLNGDIEKATQAWETAVEASRLVNRKADLQAKLLGYLAGGTK